MAVIKEVATFSPEKVIGAYAKTKAEASQAVLEAVKQGLNAVIVHPSGSFRRMTPATTMPFSLPRTISPASSRRKLAAMISLMSEMLPRAVLRPLIKEKWESVIFCQTDITQLRNF